MYISGLGGRQTAVRERFVCGLRYGEEDKKTRATEFLVFSSTRLAGECLAGVHLQLLRRNKTPPLWIYM